MTIAGKPAALAIETIGLAIIAVKAVAVAAETVALTIIVIKAVDWTVVVV